ncbi:MAG TPA: TlyA family RNA methyltransferase [Terriglobia bacterium]|nr:TlyA family RNA methyltransferase [Terriglobia bacterium]
MKRPSGHAVESEGKVRLDRLLADRGFAESRQRAQALILAGQVLADGQKLEKCGAVVRAGAEIRIVGERLPYVSRGGLKLQGALDAFHIDPSGKICLDVGASTGGFTDCLLQRGAARVVAVDAGTNQIDWKLRNDPRVRVHEKTNARYLRPNQLGETFDLVTMDVSFISATMILPVLPPLLKGGARLLVLVKPQFEVGRGQVGKGGVVRDPVLHQQALDRVSQKTIELGFEKMGEVPSSILGASGNREFFLHAIWPGRG